MSSDSEIDDLQHFEASRDRELRRRAGIGQNQFEPTEMSDEEVMDVYSESSDDDGGQEKYYGQDEETLASKRARTNRETERNWGSTRDNYFGGEDDIGEDEGASEDEEAEAVRLREQELEDMDENDFVDADDLEGWSKNTNVDDLETDEQDAGTSGSALGSIDPSSMSFSERKELLGSKFPAVALLTQELEKVDTWTEELESDDKYAPDEWRATGRAALSTYKGMIYAFFALFSDRLNQGDLKGLSQLDEHPVNEALLLSRQLWLNFRAARPDTKLDAGKLDLSTKSKKDNTKPSAKAGSRKLSAASFDEASADSEEDIVDASNDASDAGSATSDVDEFGSASDDDASSGAEDEDEFAITRPQPVARQRVQIGDFDETADSIEQQERAKNKQSLRFYTSQIGKNDRSKQATFAGDDDLPYTERDFERRQRLMAEAKKRGEQQRDRLGGDDLEDDFADDGELADGAEADALNMYQATQDRRSAQREQKQQRHEDALEAARAGRLAEYMAENPDADKRAINYQIEKNKGLTKKRKKADRNARVKKRLRYEAAQKKLKGVRRVYSAPQGPYQGELSGIRKNVSHSSRFKS